MEDFDRSVSVLVNASAKMAVEEIRLYCIPDNVRMAIGAYRSKEWERVILATINNCTSDLKLALKLALERLRRSVCRRRSAFLVGQRFYVATLKGPTMSKTPGQVAYEAYLDVYIPLAKKDWDTGAQSWKDAWEAAALAVLGEREQEQSSQRDRLRELLGRVVFDLELWARRSDAPSNTKQLVTEARKAGEECSMPTPPARKEGE